MKYFFAFFVLGSGVALAQISYVPPTQTLHKRGYQYGLGADMFTTSQIYDESGKKNELDSGESFHRYQVDGSFQYGLVENLQIGFGARFRMNQSTFHDASGNEVNGVGSGLQSVATSGLYSFAPVGNLHYALEGIFRYTPYTNEVDTIRSSDSLILGDDGNEYSAGLGVSYNWPNKNYLSTRVGYRRPGKDLSGEVYWQLEGTLAWKYLALIAGVDGISSLKNDAYTDDPNSKPRNNTGATALYSGVNREWITPYAGLNIGLGESWRLELKGSQVVSGRSTDLGTSFGINLIRRVDKIDPRKGLDQQFKTYDIEATVTKVSAQKGFLVIDKGISDDVQKGIMFDFFEFDYVGGNVLVARGVVVQAKASSSIVKITSRYNTKKELKEGLVARGSLK